MGTSSSKFMSARYRIPLGSAVRESQCGAFTAISCDTGTGDCGPHWQRLAKSSAHSSVAASAFSLPTRLMDIYTSINIHCVVAESSSIESLWLDNERSRASAATLAESEFVSSESLDDKAISDGSWGGAGKLVTCSVVVNNFVVLMPSFDVDESDGASLFCWQVALKVVRLQGPHGRSRLVSTSTSPLIPVKMTPQHTVFLWNKQNI